MKRFFLFLIILTVVGENCLANKSNQAVSDSLFAKGVELYNLNRYEYAIPLFRESDRIDKAILDSASNRRDYSSMWMASCLYLLGDSITAQNIDPEFYKFKPIDRRLTVQSDSLSALGMKYYANEDYDNAIRCISECANIERKVTGEKHPWYANSLFLLGNSKINNGEPYGIADIEKYCEIISMNYPENSIQYILALKDLVEGYAEVGNNEDAIKIGNKSLSIIEKSFGKSCMQYLSILEQLSYCHYNSNNFYKAIEITQLILSIREQMLGKINSEYVLSLSNLAEYYNTIGNYHEAIKCANDNLAICEQLFGKRHQTYASHLLNLARYNSSASNFLYAITLETEALDIYLETIGKNNSEYASGLMQLASDYSATCNYSLAIQFGLEAVHIQELNFGKEHPYYAGALATLANIYVGYGNYSEALRIGIEALNIRGNKYGTNNLLYAKSLYDIALHNSLLGNYTEALRLGNKALDIRQKLLGKSHPDYAQSLTALASYNLCLGNLQEAINQYMLALKTYEITYGKSSPIYAECLLYLAFAHSKICNYREAINIAKEVIGIIEDTLGNHIIYSQALTCLSACNLALGNFQEAFKFEEKAVKQTKLLLGEENPIFVNQLASLTICAFCNNDLDQVYELTKKTNLLESRIIQNLFANLTSFERRNTWNVWKLWFEQIIHWLAYKTQSEVMDSNGYDAILLAKGVLLSSEREFAEIIKNSNDPIVISIFNDLQNTRSLLYKRYEEPITEITLNTDSLENIAQKYELELLEKSKVYGDFTHNMIITWREVRQKLKPKDVAIEFVSFPALHDSIIYAAYVIKPDMSTPRMVSLFETKQLEKIPVSKYYSSKDLSSLVWGNLYDYLENADNVFFAPSGEFYNIAIESLPDLKGEGLISDNRKIHRLSSTRELALIKDNYNMRDVALYGGLKYDTDVKTMANDAARYPNIITRDFQLYNLTDSLGLRAGVSYLPATMTEVKNIDKSFRLKSITPRIFTDTIGTELSFKALSGKSINLMHIATHGFYWTQQEVRRLSNIDFLKFGAEIPKYEEDKALTRSGLLFTGANIALRGKPLPDNVQDGILTAQEIAQLDLRGLDMVVLSACQTGLGEVTGDGVFGLQRGFKKAGANSILMSLWKVDDKATQMLMTRFYEHFLSGKTKQESLKLAQNFIRDYEEEIEITDESNMTASQRRKNERMDNSQTDSSVKKAKVKPFEDPKYWAAFILLDALD